jgi:hypothetical protein
LFAVAEAEQEHEPVQVVAQFVEVVVVVSDVSGEAVGEGLSLAAGEPVGEAGEQFGEYDGVAELG